MDEKITIAVVAGISAIVGGVVTSILAPWVKHTVERRVTEFDRKRALIAEWRKMIIEVTAKTQNGEDAQELLQKHPSFLSLEPHLTGDARRAAYGRLFEVASGVHIPYVLHVIKDDIIRIEKTWKIAQ